MALVREDQPLRRTSSTKQAVLTRDPGAAAPVSGHLLASEFEAFFAAAPDGIAVLTWDPEVADWRVTRMNAAYKRSIGKGAFRAEGRTIDEVVGSALAAELRIHYERCVRTRKPVAYEAQRSLGGTERWLHVQITPIIDDDQVAGLISTSRDITDVRRQQELLRQSLLSYAAVLGTTMDGFAVIDQAGKFIDVNHALCRLLGYPSDELLRMRVHDIVTKDTVELLHDYGELLSNIGNERFELEVLDRDGDAVPVEVSANFLANSSRFFVFVRDVTQRRLYESQLYNEKEQLSLILNSIGDGVITTDPAGNVAMINPVAEMLTGWSNNDALGQPFNVVFRGVDEVMGAPDHDAIVRVLREKTPASSPSNVILESKSGMKRIVSQVISPVIVAGGDLVGTITILRDVTEQRLHDISLRESEKKFRTIFDSSGDGMFIYDLGGKILEVNSVACERLGYSREEILKMNASDLDSLDFRGEAASQLRVLLKKGHTTYETAHLARDGKTIPMETNARVIDFCGKPAVVAAARDITERKRAEEHIRYLTFHDSLTGLYNRAYFEEEMTRLSGGRSYPVSVFMLDMDGLKIINDTIGHAAGDEMLRALALLLKSTFRSMDLVARVGGDEFAVLLPNTDAEDAEKMGVRLELRIAEYNKANKALPLAASFGVATAAGPHGSIDLALNQADRNMYQDKLHRTTTTAHGIVKSLLAALTEKDHISGGHIPRVAEYCKRMAAYAGLSQRQTSNLVLLAEVHDLGKVGIPDNVLAKRGPLDQDERRQIEQHTLIGYRIARTSKELSHIADFILYHHEWWNGEGYPSRLAGEDIPAECRILAIADAYDAMTNDRPYRKGMSSDAAILELRKHSGTQFDPHLVETFVQMVCAG